MSVNEKLLKANSNDLEEAALREKKQGFTVNLLWNGIEELHSDLYPNICKLVGLLLLFPLSAAVVGQSFLKLKLVKTRLRNRLLDVN